MLRHELNYPEDRALHFVKLHRGPRFISFDEAVSMLRHELNYPEDRALHFVKRFDHNKDGRLSAAEFGQFKSKIAEAYGYYYYCCYY